MDQMDEDAMEGLSKGLLDEA